MTITIPVSVKALGVMRKNPFLVTPFEKRRTTTLRRGKIR
jgi:hypothetical protein